MHGSQALHGRMSKSEHVYSATVSSAGFGTVAFAWLMTGDMSSVLSGVGGPATPAEYIGKAIL